jgi:hypothetical protein
MTGIDLLALAVPALIVLLGAYIVHQARRSRESELNYNLRKCRIALDDAEQALDNTVNYYKAEVQRLKARLGEPAGEEPPVHGSRVNGSLVNGSSVNGKSHGNGSDLKFKQARTAFARLNHPDRMHGDTDEKRIRAELFKEFWEELERIDRRNP